MNKRNVSNTSKAVIIKPPFTEETARAKVKAAEELWNTRDPDSDRNGPNRTRSHSGVADSARTAEATGRAGSAIAAAVSWHRSRAIDHRATQPSDRSRTAVCPG